MTESKLIVSCEGDVETDETGITKDHERTFGSNRSVYYLNYAGYFMEIYICQNISNRINMCSLLVYQLYL